MPNKKSNRRHGKDTGKVYLVGAGPGDPRLITLRGRELLEQADAVVYDRLASELLLRHVRNDAELTYAGKSPKRHSMGQEEINALLIHLAREGKNVVRLKGGDPFIFGRGGEEALALEDVGIEFEIVPGVTAANAAGSYAGIPLTHRTVSSSVAFITGHSASKTDCEPDWPTLAKWKGTLVFYMSVKYMTDICANLYSAGMSPHKPAAVIEKGATTRQRVVRGALSEIASKAEAESIAPPALLIIGEVTELNERIKWFDKLPLFGQKIIVTRPADQAKSMIEHIMSLGGEPILMPSIKTAPADNPTPLLNAIGRISEFDVVIFTSGNGVVEFFRYLHESGADARALAGRRIAAIGPQTADQLGKLGIRADIIPGKFTTEGVVDALMDDGGLQGARVLCPRSNIAPPDLIEQLSETGAIVEEVKAYTVRPAANPELVTEILRNGGIDWLTFTSSSTAEYFFESIDPLIISESRARIASIGPRTSKSLESLGLHVDVEANEHTSFGLICGIVDFLSDG